MPEQAPSRALRARLLAESLGFCRLRSFGVRPHELDPMNHVNNAVYLDWLEESVAAGAGDTTAWLDALPRAYRLEYVAPAAPGSIVEAVTWRDGSGWAHRESAAGAELLRARIDR